MFKKLKASFFSVLVFAGVQNSTMAQGLNGYLGPSFTTVIPLSSAESGMRTRLGVDLGRLAKNVSAELFYGMGQGVYDYGFSLSGFKFFSIPTEDSFFKLTLGAALTGSNQQSDPKYWDLGLVLPQVKLIADLGFGLGLSLNMGYEMIFLRKFTSASISQENQLRGRFLMGATLMLTSDLIE